LREHWTWPFLVTDTAMPHLHSIVQALFEHARPGGVGPRLISIHVDGALFTAKEGAAGFALRAILGFTLGCLLAHFRVLQRGFLPWVLASQTPKTDYNLYEGTEVTGSPEVVLLRANVLVEGDELVAGRASGSSWHARSSGRSRSRHGRPVTA
jgi:hypothetical protein